MKYNMYAGSFDKRCKSLVPGGVNALLDDSSLVLKTTTLEVLGPFGEEKVVSFGSKLTECKKSSPRNVYKTTNELIYDPNIAIFTLAPLNGKNMVVLSGKTQLGIIDPKLFLGRIDYFKKMLIELGLNFDKKTYEPCEDVEKNTNSISTWVLDRHNSYIQATINADELFPRVIHTPEIEIKRVPNLSEMDPLYLELLKRAYDIANGDTKVEVENLIHYKKIIETIYEMFKNAKNEQYKTAADVLCKIYKSS